MNKIVPNYGIYMSADKMARGGLKLNIPYGHKFKEGRLKDQTFRVIGTQLWNTLPVWLRNQECENVLEFKKCLDTFLKGIPDVPHIIVGTQWSNSIIDAFN